MGPNFYPIYFNTPFRSCSTKGTDNNEIISLNDALDQYTRSRKSIKEILCQKQLIGWKFKELKDKIRELISSTGYQNNICSAS